MAERRVAHARNSAEEEIANGDGSHNAGQIGEQAGGHGVTRVANAVAAGLLADLAGIVAAIAICYLFFG